MLLNPITLLSGGLDAVKRQLTQLEALFRSDPSDRDLARLYATSVTVYRAANLRAENVAQVPFIVVDMDDKPLPDHPLQQLFNRVDMYDLMSRTEYFMCFWGHNLAYKIRNSTAQAGVLDLYALNPRTYTVRTDATHGLLGFSIDMRSEDYEEPMVGGFIKKRDAIYSHGMSMEEDFDGVAPAEVAFDYAQIDPEMALTMLSFFQNRGVPAQVWMPIDTNKISDEIVKATTRFIAEKFGGSRNAGRTHITNQRWDIKDLQQKFAEMDMSAFYTPAREAVGMAFDMDVILLAGMGTADYASAFSAIQFWRTNWLKPRCLRYAASFTAQLANEYGGGIKVVPDFDAVDFFKEERAKLTETVNAQIQAGYRDLYSAALETGAGAANEIEWMKNRYWVAGLPMTPDQIERHIEKTLATPVATPFSFSATPTISTPTPEPEAMLPERPPNTRALALPAPRVPAFYKQSEGSAAGTVILSAGSDTQLIAIRDALRKQMDDDAMTRWCAPETYHVTLVHAALVDEEPFYAIFRQMCEQMAFPLTLDVVGVDVFDDHPDYNVLILRVEPSEALRAFQRQLWQAFDDHEIAMSEYSSPGEWQPHITLAYVQKVSPLPEAFVQASVNAVSVVFSRTDYRSEHVYPLAESETVIIPGRARIAEDAVYQELTNWQHVAGRKGRDYHFEVKSLPRGVADFIRVALIDGDALEDVFAEAHDFIASKAYADTRAGFVAEMQRIIGEAQRSESSRQQFGGQARSAIRRFGLLALRDGFNDVNYDPESLSADELAAFRSWQEQQSALVGHLGAEIFKEGISEIEVAMRAEMWASITLESARELGMLLGKPAQMMEWVRGNTAEPCTDCIRLGGQVHPMKGWIESGWTPTSRKTECKSFQCQCRLIPTDKPEQGSY